MRRWSLCLSVVWACAPEGSPDQGGPQNEPPHAAIEAANRPLAGMPLQLDARGSWDPDGDPMTFQWSFDHVPAGSYLSAFEFEANGTRAALATFIPDRLGAYVVEVEAIDDRGAAADPVFATIEVLEDGAPAVADAGPDLEGTVGDEFVLDASASVDRLGRPIAVAWGFARVPTDSAAVLVDTGGLAPSFVADVPGLYEVALVVDNGSTVSAPDVVDVLVSNPLDAAPVAVVSSDGMTVNACTAVAIDGTDSYDPDGDALSYVWAIQTAPDESRPGSKLLEDAHSESTIFHPDVAGTYGLSLSVFDGVQWSITPATIQAIARPTNAPPVVSAGTDTIVDAGTAECTKAPDGAWVCDPCADLKVSVGATASVTDADGDDVSLTWRVESGAATVDGGAHAMNAETTLRDLQPTGPVCASFDADFALEARDCPGEIARDSLRVTATCCGIAK